MTFRETFESSLRLRRNVEKDHRADRGVGDLDRVSMVVVMGVVVDIEAGTQGDLVVAVAPKPENLYRKQIARVSLFSTSLPLSPWHLHFSLPSSLRLTLSIFDPIIVLVVCSHMFATRRPRSFPTISFLPLSLSLLVIISVIALDCFAMSGGGVHFYALKRAGVGLLLYSSAIAAR